jgi:hypothetical protein
MAIASGFMKGRRVRPDPALRMVLRVGERLARLKPNGLLLHRFVLSDLLEIEA